MIRPADSRTPPHRHADGTDAPTAARSSGSSCAAAGACAASQSSIRRHDDASLSKAAQFIRTEAGASVSDALEYLEHGEWEMVLLLLEELGDARPQSPEFWDLLADAAHVMWLESHVAWYEWRRSEARNGALRAELCLLPTEEGGRKVPILPGKGLRPMWDIGRRTPEGELSVSIASLWVEGHALLEPGTCAPVRLLPMTPEHWRHLKPGDVITMHEMRPPSGTARITEVMPPVVATS